MAINVSTDSVSHAIGTATFFGSWWGASGGVGCIIVTFDWGYAAFSFETPNQQKTGSAGSFSATEAVDKDRAFKVRALGGDACGGGNAQAAALQGKFYADQVAFGTPSASAITGTTATVSVNFTPNTNESLADLSVLYRERGIGGPYTEVAVASGLSGTSGANRSKGLTGLGAGRHYEFFFRSRRNTANLQLSDSNIGIFTTTGDVIPPPGPPPPVSTLEWILAYRDQADMDRMSVDALVVGAAYRTLDFDLSRISILTNIAHTFEKVTAPGLENEDFYFDFDIGAGALFITRRKLEVAGAEALLLSTDLTAAAAITTITASYAEASHLWTITRVGGGALNLRTLTGVHKERSGWAWLGFDTDIDHTGASAYTAENPTFTDVDEQHFLQVFTPGFKDASGDYTGTADSIIKLGPDIARVLLERYLHVARSRIHAACFEAARTERYGAMPLVMHLVRQEPAHKIFARIETGGLADIVTDGEGVFHWVSYSDTTVRRQFFDRDFLSFSVRQRLEHVVTGVRVFYRQLPHDRSEGAVRSVERHDAAVRVRYGLQREVVREFETYLDHQTANAEAVAAALLKLGTANPRVVRFEAKSKLIDLKVADIIEITRARALDPKGRLDAVKFKITALRRNRATWISQCEATEYTPL